MNISPDIISRLDEYIRADFKNVRDEYFTLLVTSAVLVIIGVVLEGPEIFHEAREVLKKFRLWLLERGMDQSRFIPAWLLLEDHPHSWVKLSGTIGWVLVWIGVLGEGYFESQVSSADGLLQTFNETLLSDALGRTARAESNLAGALRSADSARALAMGFQAQLANSAARLREAEARVASANSMAAEARSMAEAERLERIRLEAIVAPRTLSLDQQRQIADVCRRFAGHRALVSSYGLDGEGAVLGAQILALLRSALGNANVLDNRASTIVAGGFELGVHVRGPTAETGFVTDLSRALSTIGRLATFVNDQPPRAGMEMGGGGESFPAGTSFVTVMIGVKPVPIMPAR